MLLIVDRIRTSDFNVLKMKEKTKNGKNILLNIMRYFCSKYQHKMTKVFLFWEVTYFNKIMEIKLIFPQLYS